MVVGVKDGLLEKLDKETLVDSKGLTYQAFRRTLIPKYGVVWLHISLAWLVLAGCMALLVRFSGIHPAVDVASVIGGAAVLGFTLAFLQLFLHEAAHYNLHPNRKTNDLLNDLFVSGITGLVVRHYRPIHWEHHRHLGTPMDTEITYFDPLNIRFLIEALLGIRALKVVAFRKSKADQQEGAKGSAGMLVLGFAVNLAIVGALFVTGRWPAALAWGIGMYGVFPFFGSLRQLLEHRNEYADPETDYTEVVHGAIHRLFGDGLLAGTLGGAGFNRHLLHHWDPQVSYTHLKELETFLVDTEGAAYLKSRQTTYWRTFTRLFQWT